MEIREVTVWPELIRTIFNTSVDDHDEFWCEIEEQKTRVYEIIRENGHGFCALRIDPLALHVTACEGCRIFHSEVFRFLTRYAQSAGRHYATVDCVTGGRVERRLFRLGFGFQWRKGNQTRLIKRV